MTRAIYTLEDRLIRDRQLKSLGLLVTIVSPKELSFISQKMNILLAIGNPRLYRPLLSAMEDSGKFKAVIFHFGDEYYSRNASKIYRLNCVEKVYRNHLPVMQASVLNELGTLPLRIISYVRQYYRFETALGMAKHIHSQLIFSLHRIYFIWRNRKYKNKLSYIPLGLHDEFPENRPENFSPSVASAISFIGSLHSPERKACATSSEKSLSHGYQGWGLSSTGSLPAREYAHRLCAAPLTFCPSGHFCQECFRFFEAIEVGTLPLVPAWSIGEGGSYYQKHLDIPDILIVNSFSKLQTSDIFTEIAIAGGRQKILAKIRGSIDKRLQSIKKELDEQYADYSNHIATGQQATK